MRGGIGILKRLFTQVGGFISPVLYFCFILGGFLSLLNSIEIPQTASFCECTLARWNIKTPLDYSTNIVPYFRYSSRWADYCRAPQWNGFIQKLRHGDTLMVGIDYYALTPLSSSYFPRRFLYDYHENLLNGEVIILRITKSQIEIIDRSYY